jgi:prepilin-type N-terminal cleavage/methylation domain-containing protein
MPSIPSACLEERHMKIRAREAGFTLVEIAIVLVIIGLLLGGILKGQELITSARVRNLADQASGVQAAYYGFVDRYRAIPGDMLTTQVCGALGNIWGTCPGSGPGGDGDSNIENFPEAAAVWAHLSESRFLQGSYRGTAPNVGTYTSTTPPTQAPTNPWQGPLLLARTDNYLQETGTPAPRLHIILGRNIPVNVMRELDVKIDDRQPGTGVLRAPGPGGPDPTDFGTVGQEGTTPCIVAGTPDIWNITDASVDCNGYYLF